MPRLSIAGGFYVHSSLPVSNQQCVNLYVSLVEGQAITDKVLLGTPGVSLLVSTGAGSASLGNRGSNVKNGIPYVVNGETLYSIDRAISGTGEEVFSYTALGAIAPGDRLTMTNNGLQLMILIPGGKGYIYNELAVPVLQEITAPGFRASGDPQYVVFVDGYFACTTDSKKWIVSALNDGLSWNALDFSSAESDPDIIVALAVAKNQVYILGASTTEGYQNIGGADFPFQRNNVFMDKGCSAPFSVINANNTFYMIGAGKNEGPAIWMFTNSDFQRVSTDAIDRILGEYTDLELNTAFAWSYSENGAYFVGFTLPGRTFVLELVTQMWHERKSIIGTNETRWRVNGIVSAYGRNLVTDFVSGYIGSLSLRYFTEYGFAIPSYFSTMPFYSENDPIAAPSLELFMESGVGTVECPDPQVSLAISDSNKTFSYERSRSIGKLGEYHRRIIWRRNGVFSRFATLLFRVSDPVKKCFITLEAE